MSSHTTFMKSLTASINPVSLVAGYFIRQGFDVYAPGTYVPDRPGDGKPDKGDLFVRKQRTRDWHCVEVKGHPKWSSDQMLRFRDVIIEKKSIHDKKEHDPAYYYVVGSDTEYALVFDCSHWDNTFISNEYIDKPTQQYAPVYTALPEFFTRVYLNAPPLTDTIVLPTKETI